MKENAKEYMNKETGEILTWQEMLYQFETMYDGNDPSNIFDWDEYFEEI